MVDLRRDGDVYVLTLGDDENRFSPHFLTSIDAALDAIEADPAPLVTAGGAKFFSNGLDLDWLGANPDGLPGYVASIQSMFARFLALPVPTIAAVTGHAFGGGAMLAMAHDLRLMRVDRGYWCFPEVDIQIPFTPGMSALILAKTTPRTAIESMTTGRRYTGPEASAAGLVDGTGAAETLVADAIAHVTPLAGKHAPTLGTIKATMFADALEALRAAALPG